MSSRSGRMQWLDWDSRKFVDVWVQTEAETMCVFTTSSPLFSKLMCKPIAFRRTRGFFDGLDHIIEGHTRTGSAGRNYYFGFLVDVKEKNPVSPLSPHAASSPTGSDIKGVSKHATHPTFTSGATPPNTPPSQHLDGEGDANAQLHIFRVAGRSQHRTWSAVFERIPLYPSSTGLYERVGSVLSKGPENEQSVLQTTITLAQKLRLIRVLAADDILLNRSSTPSEVGQSPEKAQRCGSYGAYPIPSAVVQHANHQGSSSFQTPKEKRRSPVTIPPTGSARNSARQAPVIAGRVQRRPSASPNQPQNDRRFSADDARFGEEPGLGSRRASQSEMRNAPDSKFFRSNTQDKPSDKMTYKQMQTQVDNLTHALKAKEEEVRELHLSLDREDKGDGTTHPPTDADEKPTNETTDEQEKVSALTEELTAKSAEFEALVAELKEVQKALGEAETSIEEGKQQHDALQSEHNAMQLEHKTVVEDLQAKHSTLKTEFDALQADQTTLQSEFKTLQGESSSDKSTFDALQAEHAKLQTEQKGLEEGHTELKREYASLQTELEEQKKGAASAAEGFETELAKQREVAAAAEAEQTALFTELTEQHNEAKETVSTLTAEKRQNKSEVQLAKKQVDIFRSEVTDAEASADKWKEKYSALESSLDEKVKSAKLQCVETVKAEVSGKFREYELDVSSKAAKITALEERIAEMEAAQRRALRTDSVTTEEAEKLENYVKTSLSHDQQARLEELDLQLGEILDEATAAAGEDTEAPNSPVGYTISGARGAYFRKSVPAGESVEEIQMDD